MRMIYIDAETKQENFARKAAKHFAENPKHYTFTDGDIECGCFFAIRFGLCDDCVVVLKIDDNHEPVNYQQLIREYTQS